MLIKRGKGFTLIEVVVAVLIFGIGLLGLSSLMMRSLAFNHSSYLRSQAVHHAYNMLDRLRANRPAAEAGEYNRDMGDDLPEDAGIVKTDLTQWINNLNALLPDGDGSISCAGADDDCTITVLWTDGHWEDDGNSTLAPTQVGVTSRL